MHSRCNRRAHARAARWAVALSLCLAAALAAAPPAALGQGQEVQPTTGIILEASPASLSESAASVSFTITARWATGIDSTDRTVSYTIAFPSGVSTSPTTLTGTVTIPANQASASNNHASLTLSNLDNNVIDSPARSITISGLTSGFTDQVHSDSVPIVDDDNAVALALTAAGRPLTRVVEGSTTRVTVTASLPSTTTALTSSSSMTINVGRSADTARPGSDYNASPGAFTLTIPANSLSGAAAFDLTALDNIPDGGSKTLSVSGAATSFTFTNTPAVVINAAPRPVEPRVEPRVELPRPQLPAFRPSPPLSELLPGWSACLGPALQAARFIDVADWDSNPAIRCARYYGITKGRTPTLFAPAEPVTRWQMALLMHRAAAPAGVGLPEATEDQGFTDLGTLSEEIMNAINTVAAIGIMPGEDGIFDPQGPVPRRSMAVILHEFLQAAILQPDVRIAGGAAPFADLGSLSAEERLAVNRLSGLDVIRGTAADAFSPDEPVTRLQMVQFITRALAYTITRPAGTTLQADRSTAEGRSVELVVSVRSEDFLPLPGARADVFTSYAGGGFDDYGACLPGLFFRLAGSEVCRIDQSDPATDRNGDLRVLLETVRGGQGVWAWTGEDGEEVTHLTRGGRTVFNV